jgi:Tol biopolymer transport system component
LRGASLSVACVLLTACAEDPLGVDGRPSDGLVFARVVDGAKDLARARLSDGSVRPITRTPDRDESWPYWSTHARRVVFQREETSGGGSDLWLWDPESGREEALAGTEERVERWPVWSPTAPWLAFAFRGGEGVAGVARVDLRPTGRSFEVLASSGARDIFFRPSFSSDGRRLVAQRRDASGRGSSLWILEPGRNPRRLTNDAAWFDLKAWFTRDDSRIVYSRRSADGGPHQIVSIDAAGGDTRPLTAAASADEHSGRPSPTRDEIAFVSNRAGSYDVFLTGLDADSVRPLTSTPDLDEYAPRWSPDGERLVLTVVEARAGVPRLGSPGELDGMRLRVLDREGEVLLETPGLMADWMPPW